MIAASSRLIHLNVWRCTELQTLKVIYVFWFSRQIFVWNISHLRRTECDMIKMCICLHVKYPLLFFFYFNATWIFPTDFGKFSCQILWKPFKWKPSSSIRKDAQTDRHNEANSEPKNGQKKVTWYLYAYIWSTATGVTNFFPPQNFDCLPCCYRWSVVK